MKRGEQPSPSNQQSKQEDIPQQPNAFSGRVGVGDIAAEINDELSAELNALNASINGPTAIQPANSFRNARFLHFQNHF